MKKSFAIIPSAGRGRRFGAIKQFLELGGRPIFIRTLEIFETSPLITGICLVVPQEEIDFARTAVEKFKISKIMAVVPGGKERQDSVGLGFNALTSCEADDIIAVHDGVRPLLRKDTLEKAIRVAQENGTCVVGTRVKETIKKVGDDLTVLETIDRTPLWSIQTPQVFRYSIFKKAIEKSRQEQFLGTDESMLVERLGETVRMLEGTGDNLKITTPDDLVLAEAILRERERGTS